MIGRLSAIEDGSIPLRLHRINRIRSIRGTLGIEGNTLTEEQITAVLDEKYVIGPPREIKEARNAFQVYSEIEKWDPGLEKDLLTAHAVLMSGLIDTPGLYRQTGVGVLAENRLIHMAPPAKRVQRLMEDLFGWVNRSKEHPLIQSSAFHYEFEFIHPFADGNGRMGRLWQTLMLSRWNRFFLHIPVESVVFEHQQEYYEAINLSTQKTDSAAFIEFMLEMILEAMSVTFAPEVTPFVTPEVEKMLKILNGEMSRSELQSELGLKDEKHFRQHYLQPAIKEGLIEMTVPGKPKSRLQRYRLTNKGKQYQWEK